MLVKSYRLIMSVSGRNEIQIKFAEEQTDLATLIN